MQEIEKELRKRVKRATTELLEWAEKNDSTYIRYEKIPWREPKEMEITIATFRIRLDQIHQIYDIIVRNGLRIAGIVINETRCFMVINISVMLE